MDDLERERDFYRQHCNELGARILRLQEEQTRAWRETRRSRTIARLIREIYRVADSGISLDEIGQRFLQVILDKLCVDRAALLSYLPEQGCVDQPKWRCRRKPPTVQRWPKSWDLGQR